MPRKPRPNIPRANKAQAERELLKLSLNALILQPMKTRWHALGLLWRFRNVWRVPHVRAEAWAERDRELTETIPITIVLALIAGIGIFVALPAALVEQTETVLATLWPVWVIQAAPMICAQAMCMQNAPAIALRSIAAQDRGDFGQQLTLQGRYAARLAIPSMLSHAVVCAAAACLLVMFTLLFGLLASFVLNIGDLRHMLDTAFASVSPWSWLRAALQASVLGAVCVLASTLLAWPGSWHAHDAHEAHKIGVRAMLVASASCALAGIGMNWLANLLGWRANMLL
jgi:hypothetical protein